MALYNSFVGLLLVIASLCSRKLLSRLWHARFLLIILLKHLFALDMNKMLFAVELKEHTQDII